MTRFKAYPTATSGAEDLVRTVYLAVIGRFDRSRLVLPRATAGDTLGFSAALYDTGYYAGFGPTRADRIRGHHLKVLDACTRMARELGEPMPDGSMPPEPPPRALRLTHPPLVGTDVRDVQNIVGAKPDGVYGPMTETAVKVWQSLHRIKPDGIWGPVSRQVALDTAPKTA